MTQAGLSDVIVVGAFRSGTNVMKLLLEQCFHARCLFNQWGWKHAPAPTLVAACGHLRPATPLVIMVKEPLSQNVSLFRHWQRTRPSLIGERSFAEFIRCEFVVHDNSFGGRGPKYIFPTPTDYWNQFYFSYMFWDDIRPASLLVRLDHLESDAAQVLAQLEQRFSLVRRDGVAPVIPRNRIRPSADGVPARLDPSEQQSNPLEMTAVDRAFILSRVSRIVFDRIFA
jgi:hypothetical protein